MSTTLTQMMTWRHVSLALLTQVVKVVAREIRVAKRRVTVVVTSWCAKRYVPVTVCLVTLLSITVVCVTVASTACAGCRQHHCDSSVQSVHGAAVQNIVLAACGCIAADYVYILAQHDMLQPVWANVYW
jgi:hypothetical protein